MVFVSAGKIQCSPTTSALLEKLGGYVLISRGTIDVKVCGFLYIVKYHVKVDGDVDGGLLIFHGQQRRRVLLLLLSLLVDKACFSG